MTGRINCLVPGCRRTIAAGTFTEWICQRHWSAVPRDLRRVYARAKRRRKNLAALNRIWSACSRRAVEIALTARWRGSHDRAFPLMGCRAN